MIVVKFVGHRSTSTRIESTTGVLPMGEEARVPNVNERMRTHMSVEISGASTAQSGTSTGQSVGEWSLIYPFVRAKRVRANEIRGKPSNVGLRQPLPSAVSDERCVTFRDAFHNRFEIVSVTDWVCRNNPLGFSETTIAHRIAWCRGR